MMAGFDIGFDRPDYLYFLLLLPLLWALSFRSLSGLGNIRRLSVLVLRSAVISLLIFALAEIQLKKSNDRMTVIYLLDQSESIPPSQRQAMMKYVVEEVDLHRQDSRSDKAGVIVFGAQAQIEIPPYDDSLPSIGQVESLFGLRTDATSLEAALKLAKATFTGDSAKRVVLVTDGNENLGDSRGIAQSLAEDGVGIDVVPVILESRSENFR